MFLRTLNRVCKAAAFPTSPAASRFKSQRILTSVRKTAFPEFLLLFTKRLGCAGIAVKFAVFSGDCNSFTYLDKFILLLIIGTCNEPQVEACKPSDAGRYKWKELKGAEVRWSYTELIFRNYAVVPIPRGCRICSRNHRGLPVCR